MPDAWERRFSSEANLEMRHDADPDGDGYTNIEEYLNKTHPYKE